MAKPKNEEFDVNGGGGIWTVVYSFGSAELRVNVTVAAGWDDRTDSAKKLEAIEIARPQFKALIRAYRGNDED